MKKKIIEMKLDDVKMDFYIRTKTNEDHVLYANGMKHDEWRFNPQPILFSDTDKLLDGQHHLAGVFP
jgi:hypothetical protein